jgi:hypothetical protein
MDVVILWLMRLLGALWLGGSLFLLRQLWFNAKLDPMIDALEKMAAEMGAPPDDAKIDVDNGRERWLAAGAVLTLATGAAMVVGSRFAAPLAAALIVQQLLYFVRQRRRELRALNAAAAAQERPSRAAVNGFYTTLLGAVLAAWLLWRGLLW